MKAEMSQRRILMRVLTALLVAGAVLSVTACGLSKQEAPASARQLTEIKTRMNELDRRVNAVPTGQPPTPTSLARYANDLQPLVDEYDDLLTDAEATHKSVLPLDDSTMSALWLLLIQRIRASHDGLARTTSLIHRHRWKSLALHIEALYADIERLDRQMIARVTELDARYSG